MSESETGVTPPPGESASPNGESGALRARLESLRALLQALRASEAAYRRLVEAAAEGAWVLDEGGLTEHVNARLAEWLGHDPPDMVGRPFSDFVAPEARPTAEELRERSRRGIEDRRDLPLLRRDGSRVWALVSAAPLPTPGGGAPGCLLWVTDVSARRRAEQSLRRRARQQAATSELAQRALMGVAVPALLDEACGLLARTLQVELVGVWELLPGGAALRLSAGIGWSQGVVGHATAGVETASHPGFVLAAGEPIVIDNLLAEERFSPVPLREHGVLSGAGAILYRPGGEWGVIGAYSRRLRVFYAEDVDFLLGVAAVLSGALESGRRRSVLQAIGERFDLLERATRDAVWDRDLETGEAWYSAGFHSLVGLDPRAPPATTAVWEALLHEEDRERVVRGLERAIAGHGSSWFDEYRLRRADGGWVSVFDRAFLARDAEGRAVRAVGAMMDVGPRRELEETRRRTRELAALGRLAGGVAHDLNNQLTAVLGYAELLLEDLRADEPALSDVREIREEALRAVALIQRLLAFGGRQLLRPRRLDPNELVAGMEARLRREAGDAVRLVTILTAGAWPLEADPQSLEDALLELVGNARRAMPEGGELTIETANVELVEPVAGRHELEPGEYVMLAVRDTGTGMDAVTRERAFEPFFTTRSAAGAPGLGLAAVYGLARQSGGGVSLESEPGRGTTVKLVLPRLRVDDDPGAAGS